MQRSNTVISCIKTKYHYYQNHRLRQFNTQCLMNYKVKKKMSSMFPDSYDLNFNIHPHFKTQYIYALNMLHMRTYKFLLHTNESIQAREA